MAKEKLVTEDDLIDFIFGALYANLDVNELHLQKEIIEPSGIQLTEAQLEHIRELLLSTGLVNPAIGFGKQGKIYLNQTGITVIKQYKLYSAYVAAQHGAKIKLGPAPKSGKTVNKEASADKSSTLQNKNSPDQYDDMAN
jgi:hypothetical protein